MKEIVPLLCIFGLFCHSLQAVPVGDVSSVRERLQQTGDEPTQSDRNAIDDFWHTAMDMMLLSEESSEIVSIRREIQKQKGTEPLSFYATVYTQIGRDHLQTAFETVDQWVASDSQTLMRRNLMILTAQMQSPLLAEFGLDRLDDPDDVVRYWAVKSVAGRAIRSQLIDPATGDEALTRQILDALLDRVQDESDIEILRAIVTFAAGVDRPRAHEILQAAAQRRAQAYMNWDVADEWFDGALLRMTGQVILEQRPSEARAALGRHFAELLSLVFQRYMADPSPLSDTQRDALMGVIAEVETQVLNRIMDQPTPFIRLIQRGGAGLEREFEAYFGSGAGAGHLASRLGFNYGSTGTGQPVHTPPRLPDPPASE